MASRLNGAAQQYQREQLRQKFNLPQSVSFHQLSLEGDITIGEHTYLNDFTRIDSGPHSEVKIGKYCAIGRYVHITSKTHDLSQTTANENGPIKIIENSVLIGNHVWIGDKVTILPGVKVGDHSIIAAHAVVSNDVKPFEIVGGIPAKHIRFNTEHHLYTAS